jgi:hypothetical protein
VINRHEGGNTPGFPGHKGRALGEKGFDFGGLPVEVIPEEHDSAGGTFGKEDFHGPVQRAAAVYAAQNHLGGKLPVVQGGGDAGGRPAVRPGTVFPGPVIRFRRRFGVQTGRARGSPGEKKQNQNDGERNAAHDQQFSFSKKSPFNQKNVQIVERKYGIGVQKEQFGHFFTLTNPFPAAILSFSGIKRRPKKRRRVRG